MFKAEDLKGIVSQDGYYCEVLETWLIFSLRWWSLDFYTESSDALQVESFYLLL
jgi:hypothetical protein